MNFVFADLSMEKKATMSPSIMNINSIVLFLISIIFLLVFDVLFITVQCEHEVPMKKAIPPLMDPPPMLPNVTDKVWMTIAINGTKVGTIEFGLFGTNSPVSVQNFLSLVKCKYGGSIGKLSGKSLCYKGSTIHRVIPNFIFQGGDITHGDGTGGESIYGGRTDVTNDSTEQIVKFTQPNLLATAGYSSSNTKNNNIVFGSQFFVSTVKTQWLTGKHIAFGRVLNDVHHVITKIEQQGTYGGTTKSIITIHDIGIGAVTDTDRKPHY